MRKTDVFYRCDFCSRVVTTSVCPGDWLEVELKFDDGITDVPDVLVKHLCKGCAKQTAEAMKPLLAVPFAPAVWHNAFVAYASANPVLTPFPKPTCALEVRQDCILMTGSTKDFPSFEAAAAYFARESHYAVEVDAGYRTAEVLAACRKYGWKAFKRVRNLGEPEIKTVKRYVDLTTGEVLP